MKGKWWTCLPVSWLLVVTFTVSGSDFFHVWKRKNNQTCRRWIRAPCLTLVVLIYPSGCGVAAWAGCTWLFVWAQVCAADPQSADGEWVSGGKFCLSHKSPKIRWSNRFKGCRGVLVDGWSGVWWHWRNLSHNMCLIRPAAGAVCPARPDSLKRDET